MPVYISMLRGVNVGSHNRIKMERFRESCKALGFERIQTYIQSGNAVFRAERQSPLAVSQRIEERILADFGLSVPVLTRTSADMNKTIQGNPFLNKRGIDLTKLHVTFLSHVPAKAGLEKMAAVAPGPDAFHHCGEAIYLHCPNGYGETKLSNTFFEKTLSVSATTRNWKTVNKLYEMALECA